MNNLNTTILDQKYITQLSGRLDRFKHKGRGVFICRCPICGDSKTDKKKTRFYFFAKDGRYNVYCHNCSYSHKFFIFLKNYDPDMFRDYSMELFQETGGYKVEHEIEEETKTSYEVNLKGLKKISSLSHTHPAKKYIDARKIPSHTHHKIYFTEHFTNWINSIIPKDADGNLKIEGKAKFDPRIVLFMTDREGRIVGCQGRTINPKNTLRYITIKFDESFPKIFGLDSFDPNFQSYVFEGPFDSLFIKNSLAMTGSDVTIEDLVKFSNMNLKRNTFVLDNEPRNKEMIAKMEKLIERDLNVCIWPPSIHAKDVNDMITKEGFTHQYIKDVIDTNTYSGLQARLKLNAWRKV